MEIKKLIFAGLLSGCVSNGPEDMLPQVQPDMVRNSVADMAKTSTIADMIQAQQSDMTPAAPTTRLRKVVYQTPDGIEGETAIFFDTKFSVYCYFVATTPDGTIRCAPVVPGCTDQFTNTYDATSIVSCNLAWQNHGYTIYDSTGVNVTDQFMAASIVQK